MEISGNPVSFYTNYELARKNLAVSMKRVATGDPFSASGEEPGSKISMSHSLKAKIRSARSSGDNIRNTTHYINTADSFLKATYDMVYQMTELAASATDPLKTQEDRLILNQEYQALKGEISTMARTLTFQEMPTIGREVMTTFDENTDKITFYQPTGIGKEQLSRDFHAEALDSMGNLIGFDKDADFSMDREGEALIYFGLDNSGNTRLKRYDIEADQVFYSNDTYQSQDTLFIDESGSLYVNNGGELKSVNSNTLEVEQVLTSAIRSSQSFSVYKDIATFQQGDLSLASFNTLTSAQSTLILDSNLSSSFALASNHAFSASGEYLADESEAGKIRLIGTQALSGGNYSEFVLDVGDADSVSELQFNEDGTRIYFIDKNSHAIKYADIVKDIEGNVSLAPVKKVVQGDSNSLNGLDLGGVNPSSNFKFVIAQDGTQVVEYEAADLRLYSLGLAKTDLLGTSSASEALESSKTAVNRVNFQRSNFGAMGLKLKFMEQGNQDYILNMEDFNSSISQVDMAEEVTRMQSFQILNQTSQAMLAQFNAQRADVLQLLR